jgi:cysteine-rich repeat protein
VTFDFVILTTLAMTAIRLRMMVAPLFANKSWVTTVKIWMALQSLAQVGVLRPGLTSLAICGDGVHVLIGFGAENCDDGNIVSGDGCDASCNVEPGYSCADNALHMSVCLGKNFSFFIS